MKLRVCLVLPFIIFIGCSSTNQAPFDNGTLDTLKVAETGDFAYLTGKPIVTVDTLTDPNDASHQKQKRFTVALRFARNVDNIEIYPNDILHPLNIAGGSPYGAHNYFDTTKSITAESPDISDDGARYYMTVYIETSTVLNRTFYFYDTTRSRTYYVCRTWAGVDFGDTGTVRLTNIPISFVTVP